MTGLPFVFAVWAIRRDCGDPALGPKLLRIKRDGQAHLDEIIANHNEFDVELRSAYLRERNVLIWANQRNRASRNLSAASALYQSIRFFDPRFTSAG